MILRESYQLNNDQEGKMGSESLQLGKPACVLVWLISLCVFV
jgi:hypothetical protein